METESGDCLYRYDDYLVSTGLDEWGESMGSRVAVRLERWPIRRRTPKGVWVGHSKFTERFVRLIARKRFACETIDEAKKSFIARKKRQIKILSAHLRTAKKALSIVETGDDGFLLNLKLPG